MRAKLTPAFIAKLPVPGTGRTIYWDAAMPGFGLMVTKNGHNSFVVDYRGAYGGPRRPLRAPGYDRAGEPVGRFPFADRARHGPDQSQAAAPATCPVGRRIKGRVAGRRGLTERVFLPCAVPVTHGDPTQ